MRPWLVAAFAGVNEAGSPSWRLPASGAAGPCSAPAALLAQDCLQRFSKVESALDWCSGRPAGHGAALLFADARGELAGVEIRAAARRVLHPDAALLAWADDPDARRRAREGPARGSAGDRGRARAAPWLRRDRRAA